jgi:hypothetical protein
MNRWNTTKSCKIESEKIDAFLNEIIEVSKRHGLSIGHEDYHGAFKVEKFSQENADWLIRAFDSTEE